MSNKTVISILLFCAFIIVCFFELIKPRFDSKESSFSGRVISIEKFERTGGCYITLRETTTKFSFFYACNQVSDISVGDSVFKTSSSEILYVKSVYDGIIRIANDQDFIVPRRARTR
jgi:hypothetical protein